MDIEKELAAMQERMFSRELLGVILEASARESEEGGSEHGGPEASPGVNLSAEQQALLSNAKVFFLKSLRKTMCFAFSRGCFAGFQQFFEKKPPADPFGVHIEAHLMDGQDKGRTDWREADGFMKELEESLPFEAREFPPAIKAVWDTMYFGVLRYSFILGCRYALSLVESTGRARASFVSKISRIEQALRILEFEEFDGLAPFFGL